MINLEQRSQQQELLDADGIPFAAIKKNMEELDSINRLLGGHAISIAGLKQLLRGQNNIVICEIGCGGGDNLRDIYQYCQSRKIDVQLIGVDIKQECIDYARMRNESLPATWICSDYRDLGLQQQKPGIIFSSLFCHHFSQAELVFMLGWMKRNCSIGFFINDLHRHFLAYHSIKLLTALFSHSYLVKNDAPLSVARGFVKREWKNMLDQAAIPNYVIQWKWAFRYLIIYRHV